MKLKTFANGDLFTAADINNYLNPEVGVDATSMVSIKEFPVTDTVNMSGTLYAEREGAWTNLSGTLTVRTAGWIDTRSAREITMLDPEFAPKASANWVCQSDATTGRYLFLVSNNGLVQAARHSPALGANSPIFFNVTYRNAT